MKLKQKVSLILSIVISLNFILPCISVASGENTEVEYDTEIDIEETSQLLAEELELYFGKIGEIDTEGYYYIKNPLLLKEEAKKNKYANEMYNIYIQRQNRGIKEVAKCAIDDQFSWLLDMLDGKTWEALGNAMATHAWNTAGQILAKALSYASKVAGASVSVAFTTASLALSVYKCRGEF